MKQTIRFHLHAMAAEEVLDFIPVRRDREIRGNDPKPYYAVYAVGHEGESRAETAVDGKLVPGAVQQWESLLVDRLAGAIPPGAPVYFRHAAMPGAAHADEAVGEVLGTAVREIGGRRFALAALYFMPQHVSRAKQADVASVEATIQAEKIGERRLLVLDVTDVTGIAVASSSGARPGFPGATLQAALAAFAHELEGQERGERTVTLEDIKKAIREGQYRPGQIFELAALREDPDVKQLAASAAEEAKSKAAEEHKKQLDQKDTQLKTAQAEIAAMKGPELVKAELAAMQNLGEPEKKYVELQAKGFKPAATDDAGRKAEAGQFVAAQLAAFAELRKAGLVPGGGASKPGIPGSDGKGWSDSAPAGEGSLMDPKNNPFLPENAAA